MEILEVPFYDDDFLKMVVRFCINMVVLFAIVRGVYYTANRKREFLLTFYMLNVMVFFICFTLKKFDLGLGMALGLFAIFGILRFRTTTIPIREMTYLFVVIGIAVINALSNKKMSFLELAFTNFTIVGMTFALEKMQLMRREFSKMIVYENMALITPDKEQELIKDLEARTGLDINRIEVGDINLLRDVAKVTIFFYDDHPVVKQRNSEKNSPN